MVRDKLIASLGRQDLSSDDDRARADQTKAPTDGAEYPRLVQTPANEEPVLVIEQICLQKGPSVYVQYTLALSPGYCFHWEGTYHNGHAGSLHDSR